MNAIWLSVSKIAKDLSDRLSQTRLNKLNNLNAALSTIAKSSTALSNAVWTNARAGFLNTTLTSRAAQSTLNTISSTVNTIKNRANVKVSSRMTTTLGPRKVQRGEVNSAFTQGSGLDAWYYDKTITQVANINRCLVVVTGMVFSRVGNNYYGAPVFGRLINTSTLRITATFNPGSYTPNGRVQFQVVEFK